MRLTLMSFTCAPQGHQFTAAHISPHLYGQFLLRSKSNDIRYLDAIADEVFEEVARLILEILSKECRRATDLVTALHAIFGTVACDPDQDGFPYRMNVFPPCPCCGTHEMAEWDAAVPPEAVELDVPAVTHQHWCRWSAAEKRVAVLNALREIAEK